MKSEIYILPLAIAVGTALGSAVYLNRAALKEAVVFWQDDIPAVRADTVAGSMPQRSIKPRGVGDLLPDFRLASLDGSYLEAKNYRGRLLLVNFWATWCQPCRSELPLLQRLWDRHQKGGLLLIAPAMDDPAEVRRFVEQFKIRFPVAIGGEDIELTNLAFGNTDAVLPYSVLVAPDGSIVERHTGQLNQAILDRWLTDHLPLPDHPPYAAEKLAQR